MEFRMTRREMLAGYLAGAGFVCLFGPGVC